MWVCMLATCLRVCRLCRSADNSVLTFVSSNGISLETVAFTQKLTEDTGLHVVRHLGVLTVSP
jgi:hypothetical protein